MTTTKPPQQDLTSDRIQDALYAFTRSQLLFSAVDLNVFTHIHNGHSTVGALSTAIGTDSRATQILLDGLVGIGFLNKEKNAEYGLPDDVAYFLVKDTPSDIGGMVKHCKRLYENWSHLTDAVRTGHPAGGAQSLVQLETYFSELVKGLYVSNYPTAQKLAQILEIGDKFNGLDILDVAGGSAVWSIALLEQDRTSKCTLLDFPRVIDVGKTFVDQHKLADRFEYWPADLEEVDFPTDKYDLAILGNICHALGPHATQNLIQNVAQSLKPGGRIAIVDFVPDDARSRTGWPLIFGVNMLITTPEGNVFTAQEYGTWLTEAGFTQVTTHDVEYEVTTIVGVLG